MAGLQFFNYDRLGFIPYDCWEECELEPTGKGLSSAKNRKRTRRAPSGYLEERRPLTPEEELITRESRELDPDRIGVRDGRRKFSLSAAANLAKILGYTKDELLGTLAGQVLAFYLAEDEKGELAGMDGVVGFFLSELHNPDVCSAVKIFVMRMVSYCPEVSEKSRRELIIAAKNGRPLAKELGIILFGRVFHRWVKSD